VTVLLSTVSTAPNLTSWGHALITTHPEYYKKDANGQIAQSHLNMEIQTQFEFSPWV